MASLTLLFCSRCIGVVGIGMFSHEYCFDRVTLVATDAGFVFILCISIHWQIKFFCQGCCTSQHRATDYHQESNQHGL